MKRHSKGRRVSILVGTVVLAVLLAVSLLYRREIRAWYLLVTRFESLPDSEEGYPEYRHNETRIVFVRLPGGRFLMGSPEEEEGRISWEPLHEVVLSPFLVAKYEVSEAEWQRIMGDGWEPSYGRERVAQYKGASFPIHQVSWRDCQEFCKKSDLTLPTEGQWEYACRAGSGLPFSGTGKLDDMGWYKENSGDDVHPVGIKEPNAFGLFDTHGNVHEWCQDDFDKDFYDKPGSRSIDPVSTGGYGHVFRGGGYDSEPRWCRSAHRGSDGDSRYTGVGFRPVFNLR